MIGRQRRRGAVKSHRQQRGRIRCLRGRVESLEPRLMLTTYLVDSLADFLPPDDPATIPADGAVTLRESLMAASLDTAVGDAEKGTSADEILFSPDLYDTIELAGASLQIGGAGGEIRVVGPGAEILTIDAMQGSRVITHVSGTAHLSGLTIRGGSDSRGGGIEHQSGTLALERLVINSNQAKEGGGLASLGGTVTITDCRIEYNYGELGGAIYNHAGGSSDAPSMIVQWTTIADNSAVYAPLVRGGGIYSRNSFLVIRDTTIEDNRADVADSADGGGIYNESNAGGGVRVERSTISGNFASSRGGGIYSTGSEDVEDTQLQITNSTISGNNAGVEGGAIFNGSDSKLSIVDSTIAYNTCFDGSGVWNESGLLELSNSIVTGNNAAFEFRNAPAIDESQPPPVFNLIGNPEGYNDWRLMDQPENHNQTNVSVDSLLGELLINGGPTRTHALIVNQHNPAIDAGSSRIIIDQRGMPVRNRRDIGALSEEFKRSSLRRSGNRESVRPANGVPGGGFGARFGVGFDMPGDPSIQKEPEFLGFQFNTGPLVMGKIKKTWLGRFGAEARLNVAGRVGLEYGYYIDSGTLDVNYSGLLSYNISTEDGKTRLATALDIEDASLYTVSPRVGAYVDLVIDLDATISAKACFVGCYGASFPISIHEKVPIFSVNRQDEDGNFDGSIKFVGEGMLDALLEGDEEQLKKDEELLEEWKEKAGLLKEQGQTDKAAAEAILSNPNATPAEKRIAADNLAEANRDIAFADNVSAAAEATEKAKTQPQQDLIKEAQRQAEIDMAEAQRELDRATREGNTAKQQAARDKLARATADVDDAKGLQNILDQARRQQKERQIRRRGVRPAFLRRGGGQPVGGGRSDQCGLGIDGIAEHREGIRQTGRDPSRHPTHRHPARHNGVSCRPLPTTFADGSLQEDEAAACQN